VEVKVTLTKAEAKAATTKAVIINERRRAYGSVGKNNQDKATYKKSNIIGYLGEAAVAKALGIQVEGPTPYDKSKADLSEDIQVRTTPYEGGHLLLSKDDHSAHRFILVTGGGVDFTLRGWFYGYEGQVEHYWKDLANNGRPAYFIPQCDLRPMEGFLIAPPTAATQRQAHQP